MQVSVQPSANLPTTTVLKIMKYARTVTFAETVTHAWNINISVLLQRQTIRFCLRDHSNFTRIALDTAPTGKVTIQPSTDDKTPGAFCNISWPSHWIVRNHSSIFVVQKRRDDCTHILYYLSVPIQPTAFQHCVVFISAKQKSNTELFKTFLITTAWHAYE